MGWTTLGMMRAYMLQRKMRKRNILMTSTKPTTLMGRRKKKTSKVLLAGTFLDLVQRRRKKITSKVFFPFLLDSLPWYEDLLSSPTVSLISSTIPTASPLL